MSTEKWQKIDELFDRVLDAEDPSLIEQEPDTEVAESVRQLWKHHVGAVAIGFLEQPVTLVRNLLDRVAEASPEDEPRAFSDGALLGGQFLIKGLLGEGGMGQVYLAYNQKLGKLVALKTIRPSLAEDPAIRGRFVGEIRSAQAVTHRNVCRIHDLFADGQTPFCSMEYLPGPTLDEFTLEPGSATAQSIALQLAEGLSAAHTNGIIHRDFKPQNVILIPPVEVGGFPRAVITDFGLARPVVENDVDGGAASHSLRGAGTRDYMAPELLRGEAASIGSDIFAFGKVLERLMPSSKWIARCTSPDALARPVSLQELIWDFRGESRVSRRAILMGATFGAVGLGSAGYAVYRSKGAPRFPLMPTRQRLILNGLQSSSALGERAFTIRQLLITGLRQSPMLGVIPDERLLAVLRRLKLPVSLPVTLTDLFAVAKSEKAAVVVDGAVEKAARGLRILLRVFEPGVVVPAFEMDRAVDDEQQLVRLARDAAMELRTEFAESGQSLKASSVPLEQVTSASPEAVDLYFRGVREYERADVAAALAYLDRALDIDATFPVAHLYRAQALRGLSRGKQALEAAEKAYAVRHRVTERERNWIEYFYFDLTADVESSLTAIRKNAVLYPEEAQFQRFTGAAYARLGRFSEALPFNRAAVELDEFGVHNMGEFVTNLAEGSAADEAIAKHDEFREKGVTHPVLENGYVIGLMLKDRFREADAALDRLVSSQLSTRWTGLQAAASAVLQGRFLGIVNTLEGDLAYDKLTGEDRYRHHRLVYAGHIRLSIGQPEAALRHITELCGFDPRPSAIYPLRAGLSLAAANGFDSEAELALAGLKSLAARWPSSQTKGALASAEAEITASKGDLAAAKNRLELARGLWPDPLTLFAIVRYGGDPAEGVLAATAMHALRGKVIKSYYAGLIVLTELERARNLMKMSLFEDALRGYKRVEFHWGPAGDHVPLMRDVRSETAALVGLMRTDRKGPMKNA